MRDDHYLSNALLDKVLEKLQTLRGEEFQDLIIDHLNFRSSEFRNVEAGPRFGQDGGVDIKATIRSPTGANESIIFSCKRRKENLGPPEVQELFAVANSNNVRQAVLTGPSELTESARTLARKLQSNASLIFPYQNWTGRGLAATLVTMSPQLLVKRFPDIAPLLRTKPDAELLPSFEILDLTSLERTDSADWFYNGFPPNWSHLDAKYDLLRSSYTAPNGCRAHIEQLLRAQSGALTIFALVGVSGAGKTTLLRRAAYDMWNHGFQVVRLLDDWQERGHSVYAQILTLVRTSRKPTLVVIDDAAEFLSSAPLSRDTIDSIVRNMGIPVVILMAEEPHHWNRVERGLIEAHEKLFVRTSHVSHLSDQECEDLVDKIIALEATGQLAAKGGSALDRAERLLMCRTRADRQLLVAMLQIRHGEGFSAILRKEFDRLAYDKRLQEAYALTSYFQTLQSAIPSRALLKICGFSSSTETALFQRATVQLIVNKGAHFVARHAAIARVISRYVYETPEARQHALQVVLCGLDMWHDPDRDMFVRFMVGPGWHKRIVSECNRESHLLEALYNEIVVSSRESSPYIRKFVHSAHGMALRVLGDVARARQAFQDALKCDSKYGFAGRQLAWLEHSIGNLRAAAHWALQVADWDKTDIQSQIQGARLLELNTFENFKRAGEYYERALTLAPLDKQIRDAKDNYARVGSQVLPAIDGLRDDDILPDTVIQDLRPSLTSLRGMLGVKHKSVRMKLWGTLFYMQEDVTDDENAIHDIVGDIEHEADRGIRALIACNIARSKYLRWYHRGSNENPDEIERLFNESMKLAPLNPFSFCWYGTFLKEMKKDAFSADVWASPAIPDTFDRWDDAIGGVRWKDGRSVQNSSVRR